MKVRISPFLRKIVWPLLIPGDKRQEFQNDALIALSAERQGAAIVTSNQKDFDLLGSELKVSLVLV